MRYFSVITLLFVTSAVTSSLPKHLKRKLNLDTSKLDLSEIKVKLINQPLDNFNPHDNRTLKMRYAQNLELWKPGGPIYIDLGGEDEFTSYSISASDDILISQMAKDTNGAMFATEHRYYGQSLPDISKNDKIQYFKFLSSQQALADVANLIRKLKSEKKYQSSKVVVVGGSYAGNLAAWMREQYPNLVDAAVAASAPVLAKKNFYEYLDVVRYTFTKYGTKHCLQNVDNTFKRYKMLLKSESGIQQLKRELNICPGNNLTVLENKRYFFSLVYDDLMEAAQYGSPSTVTNVCRNFGSNNKTKFSLDLFHLNTTRRLQNNGKCKNADFNTYLLNRKNSEEAWTYQSCTEFGYFQTTSSEKHPFVHWNPLEFELEMCKGLVNGDIEKRVDEGVAKINAMYGGLTPKVSKVVFTHGDMDPWHVLGVQRDLAPDVPAFTVNGTTHCDILYARYDEPKEMTTKRKSVKNLIKRWISSS